METSIQRFVQKAVFAASSSILIGLLFFGTRVFDYSRSEFQFVAFGIFGAIILAVSDSTSTSKSVAVVVLVVVVQEAFTRPFTAYLVLRDILFLLGIGFTIILNRSFFAERLKATRVARPLVLAGMLALNAIVVTEILKFVHPILFEGAVGSFAFVAQNLSLQFLIGIGLGVGKELSELRQFKLRSS